MTRSLRGNAGFSLVELMIALALGLVIQGGGHTGDDEYQCYLKIKPLCGVSAGKWPGDLVIHPHAPFLYSIHQAKNIRSPTNTLSSWG
jgi:prepilin-type N-terminal cleavage/methylation domain-containing protein